MKQYATISADVVASTSLHKDDFLRFTYDLREFLQSLEGRYDRLWCRLIFGDNIECLTDNPADAFEVAILLKLWIKAWTPRYPVKLRDRFNKYAVRIAIALGPMDRITRSMDYMCGPAIERSRDLLKEIEHSKATSYMRFDPGSALANAPQASGMGVIVSLIDIVIRDATKRQCLILFHRIWEGSSQAAASKLGITVSGINNQLKKVGYDIIQQALDLYTTSWQSNTEPAPKTHSCEE